MDSSPTPNEPAPSEDLVFDGERFIPGSGVGIAYEHWARYALAGEYVRDLDVIEVACGEGYGTAWLAERARSVRAFDIDEGAVQHAIKHYAKTGARFERASVREFFESCPAGSVDAVVAFEIIEHLEVSDQEFLLAGIAKVLRPGGFALISTPDKLLYTDRALQTNPFHVREYYRDEFSHELLKYFKRVSFFDEALFTGAALVSPGSTDARTFQIQWTDLRKSQGRPVAGLRVSGEYLIALVGQDELPGQRALILADFSRKLIAEGLLSERRTSDRLARELEEARRAWQGATSALHEAQRRLAEEESLQTAGRRAREKKRAELARTQELQARFEHERDEAIRELQEERARSVTVDKRVEQLLAHTLHLGREYGHALEHSPRPFLGSKAARLKFLIRTLLGQPVQNFRHPRGAFREARRELQRVKLCQQIEDSGLFDRAFYLSEYPDVARQGVDPLKHFLAHGANERRRPHPLFDTEYYLQSNPDVVKAGLNPLVHFIEHGASERRRPHPLFDIAYYLETNPDVAEGGINPLLHFVRHGVKEGRKPNPRFDPAAYIRARPEAELGDGPLAHFARFGPLAEAARARNDRLRSWAEKAAQLPRQALVIDATLLTPDRDSGSITTLESMRLLQSLGFAVTYLGADSRHDARYRSALEDAGFSVLDELELQSIDEFLERHGDLFEVVLVCRVSVACHLVERIRRHCQRASLIFDTIDLHYLRMEREAALTGSAAGQKQALATKALELRVAATADAVIVHSDSELEILQREVPAALSFVVPYVLDARGKWNGYAARKDLLFLGGFRHRPNVDAVQYFVREILPQVRREIPDIRLRIVGSEPTAEVRALESDGVVVSGYVEDLTSVFESTRVMVAPLRYGAGYKGKVAMSLAHGVPPVLTPIAAEGMRLVDGAEVLIADAPKDFARAVVRLYQDESLWELLSCKGLKLVQQRFSRAAVRPIFEQLLSTAGVASWDDRPRFLASGRHRLPGRAIFPSRFMRELYQRAGITFEGDALVPHGVRFPDPRPRDVDRSQLIDKTALRLLFAGRIVRFKGAHTAVESLGLIQSRLPHLKVELSIVGDRTDRTYVAELEQLIHEKGLDAVVKFEPAVREDEVSQLFQRHDIYLFPSLFEPFALTLILALEAGIPTVASATGGNFDLIRDHETGILVPPGDPAELAAAVHELTTRPDLRRSISERGRSAARAFGLGRMLDGLERALEENTAGSTPDRQVAS